MRTADGPTSKLPIPRRPPTRAYPPVDAEDGNTQGATARFIGTEEPDTHQRISGQRTEIGLAEGAVFLLRGAQITGSAKGLTRWEISDFPRGDTA